MVFSSLKFIFFLLIVLISFFILGKFKKYILAKLLLVISSLFFYAQGSYSFFPFFLASIFGNYFIGTALIRIKQNYLLRKVVIILGILANCALLGYYKYVDFFIENINFLFTCGIPYRNIILPIGISFFTFQLIAYLVDSYRGFTNDYNILDYLLFITFFPQLIVGPIVHHSEMVPQFETINTHQLDKFNLSKGLFLFSIGLAKKVLIADNLTNDAQTFFINYFNPTIYEAWYHSIQYTISYYFDLSGYADMAIGIGWMFNIKIPTNFNSPYKARDFQEYWRRWHITLSRFLGDYIFKSYYKKGNRIRNYYWATMLTFFVSGFWHGSGWTFVIWGLINGLLVCLAAYTNRKNMKVPIIPAFILTQIAVVLLRTLFVANDFTTAIDIYTAMFNFHSLGSNFMEFKSNLLLFLIKNRRVGYYLFIGVIIAWFLPNSNRLTERFDGSFKYAIFSGSLLAISFTQISKVADFLYFQF